MASFVDTLKRLSSWQSLSLTTQSPLPSAELARGYVYQQWVNASPRNRDRHRYLLALRNRRSPFDCVLEEAGHEPSEAEYLHDGLPAKGIGAAHLMDGLAISLPVTPKWATSWLIVDIQRLGENDIEHDKDRVRHCSAPVEADEHELWARDTGLHTLSSPTELLAVWDEFFPSLERLPRFDRDLMRLDVKWFRPVRKLLAELQTTAADHWDLSRSPEPDWRNPHITPESQSRRHLCTFTDPASARASEVFSWHGRMTPGKGRLYFRLVPERKVFRLAYVGPKPGSDRESS
ncbi:hypothetical protein ACFU99_18155 [Streptomyces sp. NPDC057654]|uniref:hypothetical protein n=1 Tax=Streptomyces sp. NPDC057654 TaxID=3346196 RepID=UPI0036BE0737